MSWMDKISSIIFGKSAYTGRVNFFLDAKERLSMEHLFSAHPQQGAAQQETGVCPQEGQLRECCRQWFLTEGDVDDFIFYGSQPRVSER